MSLHLKPVGGPTMPGTGALPDNLRPRIFPSGRIGWPEIVQYDVVDESGDVVTRLDLPPSPGVAYEIKIHDLDRYESLFRAGWVLLELHTGAALREPWVNPFERKAS